MRKCLCRTPDHALLVANHNGMPDGPRAISSTTLPDRAGQLRSRSISDNPFKKPQTSINTPAMSGPTASIAARDALTGSNHRIGRIKRVRTAPGRGHGSVPVCRHTGHHLRPGQINPQTLTSCKPCCIQHRGAVPISAAVKPGNGALAIIDANGHLVVTRRNCFISCLSDAAPGMRHLGS